MNIGNLTKAAILIFTALLAISCYAIYLFQNMPLERSVYVPTCQYRQEATYSYHVLVEPSILYDNRTVLLPGETAYIPLTKEVIILFTYRFISDPPPRGSEISYRAEATLEAKGGWSKTFPLIPLKTSNSTILQESYTIKINQIDTLIKQIEKETETRSTTYTYRITTTLTLKAVTDAGNIQEIFNPEIKITLDYGGKKLEFNGLAHTDQGTIGVYKKAPAQWTFNLWTLHLWTTTVQNMRYLSYTLTATTATALTATLIYLLIKQPPSEAAIIKKKYGAKIVETAQPGELEGKRTIHVTSIEDLAKVAEEAVKPILHQEIIVKEKPKTKRHVFYVLDADTRYEYTTEETIPEKPKKERKPKPKKPPTK